MNLRKTGKSGCRSNFEIIAHRGASFDAPENTLPAVRRAWRQRADGVEIDLRQTADGDLIVFHDADFRRIAGNPLRISAARRADLARIDAGIWRGPKWRGVRLPYLSDVLRAVPRTRRLWLELKNGSRQMLVRLAAVLRESGVARERIVIIGFSRRVMRRARRQFEGIPIFLNVAFRRSDGRWKPSAPALAKWVVASGLDGLHLQARPGLRPTIQRLKAAGLQVYCWTVDDAKCARELRRAGCDGVTTNRPGWLRRQLNA